jgi:hypothetical protein
MSCSVRSFLHLIAEPLWSNAGAGPIDHATNALWTQEIMKILTRDDAYIFAEPVDRELYPE